MVIRSNWTITVVRSVISCVHSVPSGRDEENILESGARAEGGLTVSHVVKRHCFLFDRVQSS